MNAIERYEEGWFFYNHAWGTLHEILKNIKSCEEKKTLLDFGAGSGIMAAVIRAVFPEIGITVTDIDKSAMKFWNERNLDYEFSPGVIERFYDIIVCSHVLEHLENPGELLKTFSKIGKRIILVVPDGKVEDPTHKQIFNRSSFKKLIDESIEWKSLKIYPQYHPHINNLIAVIDI